MDSAAYQAINGLAGHNRLVDDLFVTLARFGPFAFVFVCALLWFWPGDRAERERRQLVGFLAAVSVLVALGVNQVIGRWWYRPRPFIGHTATLLLPGSRDASFPSDHAAFAFAAAVTLLMFSRRLGGAALLFAGLVAFARVYVGEHYVTDVVGGALVGSVVSLGLWSLRGSAALLLAPLLRVARRLRLA
ncbi:MAG: phosphatase PAP2 family protein [Actinobacteria bacterium]|nr:phosphatase PAP2 family protein [Actinomycetota bacterium]